ncbi:UNVERIFIED_CONTAM: hypothetical protein FKN15_072559 [Acipenser sinensis]
MKQNASFADNEWLENYLSAKENRQKERARQRQQQINTEQQHVREGQDPILCYLLSLAPALRRISPAHQSLTKLKINQVLHEAEFGQVIPRQIYQPTQQFFSHQPLSQPIFTEECNKGQP